jgi:hypothetical protein
MATDTLAQALTALNQADPNHHMGRERHAIFLYRQTVGCTLHEAAQAINAAVASEFEASRFLVESMDQPIFWRRYEFPNGHSASVIVDLRHTFRFEVESTDPDDTTRGGHVAGLTTEQVEAKLAYLHSLPAHADN